MASATTIKAMVKAQSPLSRRSERAGALAREVAPEAERMPARSLPGLDDELGSMGLDQG